jgi:hypothetical protein
MRTAASNQQEIFMHKPEFVEAFRAYVADTLLTDELIGLAYDAGMAQGDILNALQPLLTSRTSFSAQTLLHCAFADLRKTGAVLADMLDALSQLADWDAGAIRTATLHAACGHGVGAQDTELICKYWVLFGPSPLCPFRCIEVLGRERAVDRGAEVLASFQSNTMVS